MNYAVTRKLTVSGPGQVPTEDRGSKPGLLLIIGITDKVVGG
jgi:hypothetical protein